MHDWNEEPDAVPDAAAAARLRAGRAYHDPTCPLRTCEACGRAYRGPAVYCSLSCAELDAR